MIHHKSTPERIQYRKSWGYEAGRHSFSTSKPREFNPFIPAPHMPMHMSWFEGWDAAASEAEAEEQRIEGATR